ncbi:MAG: hypothetical protein JXR78_05640 [Victivallales bacterium]|nr:hypothetical protein [Victivallales bacterium]
MFQIEIKKFQHRGTEFHFIIRLRQFPSTPVGFQLFPIRRSRTLRFNPSPDRLDVGSSP